jgi:hypothetical protein
MNIELSASENLKRWTGVGSYFIFKYSGASYNVLAFNLSGVRYLRLETTSRLRLAFPRIQSLTKKSDKDVRNVPLNEIDMSANPDKEASVYYYPNEKRKIISRISLNFSDDRFHRRYELYAKSGKQYTHLMSGSVSQSKPTQQIIDLRTPTRDPVKLLIINRDDKPLTLEKFTITGPKEILVFELPREEKISPLRIYYGNRYIRPPDYDIRRTFDAGAKYLPLKIGKHTANAQFGYSIIEPPVSTWIIRALFIAGFLSLLWPGYRIIKKYTDDMEKNKQGTLKT